MTLLISLFKTGGWTWFGAQVMTLKFGKNYISKKPSISFRSAILMEY